jgi:3-oxo-5alpha-steroid 4-dehydrogenase
MVVEVRDVLEELFILEGTCAELLPLCSNIHTHTHRQTDLQKASNINDSVEKMFKYILKENGSVLRPEVIRMFCEESPKNFRWLEQRCQVRFRDENDNINVFTNKTSYPPSQISLYRSGNETLNIPRGHRAFGEYLTGNVLYDGLYRQLEKHPKITIATHTRAIGLLMDRDNKRCTGIRVQVLPKNDRLRAAHVMIHEIGSDSPMIDPTRAVDRACVKTESKMFQDFGSSVDMKASAVILCTGGFFFNDEMVSQYAPKYSGLMPLGNLSDDGAGILMAMRDANARTKSMDRKFCVSLLIAVVDLVHKPELTPSSHTVGCSAWKFINPPSAFARAVLINRDGKRITREDKYGATIADELLQHHDGRGYLILDETMYTEALAEVNDTSSELQPDQRMQARLNLLRNRKVGHTLSELEFKCKIPQNNLQDTIRAYNRSVQINGKDEAFGKSKMYLSVFRDVGPYYAIRMDLKRNPFWPTPAMSLGGLEVDGRTGMVISSAASLIPGLYAAGRCACGIASNYYISGLSLADCIFSGRRAGRHAASTISIPSNL